MLDQIEYNRKSAVFEAGSAVNRAESRARLSLLVLRAGTRSYECMTHALEKLKEAQLLVMQSELALQEERGD